MLTNQSLVRKLNFLYLGGDVQRYHTLRTCQQDTVATHSQHVAALVWLLTNGLASGALLARALLHDMAEQYTGDMPAPFKRQLHIEDQVDSYEQSVLRWSGLYDSVPPASVEEQRVLKLADCLDGMLFCLREVQARNLIMEDVFWKFESYIISLTEAETTRAPHPAIYDNLIWFQDDPANSQNQSLMAVQNNMRQALCAAFNGMKGVPPDVKEILFTSSSTGNK